MTDTVKSRKLSHEILRLIVLSAAVSLVLFLILSRVAVGLAEAYCFENDIPMTEFQWISLDRWIFGVSAALACCSFSVMFLTLLADKIAYIRTITAGIDALHNPGERTDIVLEGNNELTQLAAVINRMSLAQQQLWEKEQALAQEKEQLVRTLSHDIRTPLTSILAYSDYLAGGEEINPADRDAYLRMIRKKAEQIRDLSAVLLDGNHRAPQQFDDGKLLLEQLAAEFEEALEEDFFLKTDFAACPEFSGCFDVQELRRIFDNLGSNVRKYADPAQPVTLRVAVESGALWICQSNGVLPGQQPGESYQIGLASIRRIAQFYGGKVNVEEDGEQFFISIRLADL